MPRLEMVLPAKVQQVKLMDEPKKEGENLPALPGHDAGFDAGYQQGLLQAKWEMKKQSETSKREILKIMSKLGTIHTEFETLVGEHLPDLIHGALDRVFRKHHFSMEEVTEEIMALLHDMEHAGRLTLECATQDQPQLAMLLSESHSHTDPAKFSIHGNPNLKPGEFLLKSDLGNVDGRHSSRIRQITQALEVKQ